MESGSTNILLNSPKQLIRKARCKKSLDDISIYGAIWKNIKLRAEEQMILRLPIARLFQLPNHNLAISFFNAIAACNYIAKIIFYPYSSPKIFWFSSFFIQLNIQMTKFKIEGYVRSDVCMCAFTGERLKISSWTGALLYQPSVHKIINCFLGGKPKSSCFYCIQEPTTRCFSQRAVLLNYSRKCR